MNLSVCFHSLKNQFHSFDDQLFKSTFPEWNVNFLKLCALQSHNYASKPLALTALTHRSALVHWPKANGFHSCESNERLEFLGDNLLGMFLSLELMARHSGLSEGELSRARAALASTRSLATKARQLELGDCVFMGKGERLSGGALKESVLADVFEATLASLFIDAGEQKAWQWLDSIFSEDLDTAHRELVHRDPKSSLQEWMQAAIGHPPDYRVIQEAEKSAIGNLMVEEFCMGVYVGESELGRGIGLSKAEASQKAASAVWAQIKDGKLSVSKALQIEKEGRS